MSDAGNADSAAADGGDVSDSHGNGKDGKVEGSSIGQYKIVRKIGEGGMGAVYLAEHTLIGRRAAIKVLLPQLSMQKEIVERFFNEARATTAIADPGIVQVFDFGLHTDGSAYIVMEFLEGEPLDARMKRAGRLTPYEALRITRQACDSLQSAHNRGIIHRDLKPENIFLVKDKEAQGGERPKILDFGIAKLGGSEASQSRTRTGAMMGTPVYMSPEQCRGAGSVDHRSDIYAMGCVLFHILTGRPPFEAEGIGEVIAAHLREPPRPPSVVVSGLPDGVDDLVVTCLQKDPGARYQSMGDLSRAADALMARITATGLTEATTRSIATPVPPGFRSEFPQNSHAPITQAGMTGTAPHLTPVPTGPNPTTLTSAAGAAGVAPAPSNKKYLAIVGAIVFAGAAIAAGIFVSKSKDSSGTNQPAAGVQEGTDSTVGSGSGSASGGPAVALTPDAGVPAVAADAAVTATADVTPPDAGAAVAVDKPPVNVKQPTKKCPKGEKLVRGKCKKTGGTSSGSSSEDLYGDR